MVLLTLSRSSLRPSCRCLQFPSIHPARLVLSVVVLLLLRHHAHSVPAGLQDRPCRSSLQNALDRCSTLHASDCSTARPSASLTGQTLNKPVVSSSSHEIKRSPERVEPEQVTWLQSQFPFATHFGIAFLSLKADYMKM